jgi:hypothetical protein
MFEFEQFSKQNKIQILKKKETGKILWKTRKIDKKKRNQHKTAKNRKQKKGKCIVDGPAHCAPLRACSLASLQNYALVGSACRAAAVQQINIFFESQYKCQTCGNAISKLDVPWTSISGKLYTIR